MNDAIPSSIGSVSGTVMHTAVLGRKEPSSSLREDKVDPNDRAVLAQPGHTSPSLHYHRGREDMLDFLLLCMDFSFGGSLVIYCVRVAVLVITCP